MKNHGQSLEQLAERGGLDLRELLAIIEGLTWRQMPRLTTAEALARVRARLIA